MTGPIVHAWLLGAVVLACVAIGVFFLRYWRLTRDTFFVWFALAFFAFAVSWAVLAADLGTTEHTYHVYSIRLLGFVLIAVAILRKNRRGAK